MINIDSVSEAFVHICNQIDPTSVCGSYNDIDQSTFNISHIYFLSGYRRGTDHTGTARMLSTQENILHFRVTEDVFRFPLFVCEGASDSGLSDLIWCIFGRLLPVHIQSSAGGVIPCTTIAVP